jgi:hypothetical protein
MPNTDAEIRHIYERWHATVVGGDLDGLMALYADDAILETPLILAHPAGQERGNPEGQSRDPAFLRKRLSQAPQRSRALVPHRHVLFQRPPIDLGVSARDAAGRSGRPRRSHGYRRRPHRPSSGLLGMGRIQVAQGRLARIER